MAKKKIDRAEVVDTTPVAKENSSTAQDTVETLQETSDVVESQESVEQVKPTPNADTEIPDGVKNILKVFANTPEMYVNPKTGGTFDVDTKPSMVGEAILYKNPFYHS